MMIQSPQLYAASATFTIMGLIRTSPSALSAHNIQPPTPSLLLPLWTCYRLDTETRLPELGFYSHKVGSHYLWSGEATILHFSGIPEHTIKFIGRW